ncbi:hypothetical protein [Devosia sediminis]|uniref:Uncharacterized protein n=1 Tax=Devosia sediminis TaxID=2798801 RepID=A0A934IRH2_9HYPH|nr:hypothetical protein [Devosia sediminis]MBJ3783846.1 hypothetical protein [Devosia sediminis]
MADLSPRLREIRDEMAPHVLAGLLATKARVDAGWPITAEDRNRLNDEIEYWSKPHGQC